MNRERQGTGLRDLAQGFGCGVAGTRFAAATGVMLMHMTSGKGMDEAAHPAILHSGVNSRVKVNFLNHPQRTDNHKVTGKVAGRNDSAVGTETTAIVADKPDNVSQQQQTCTDHD